jgi:hypothetical protein
VRHVALALLVIVSLGCTVSLQEVRQRPPAFTAEFPQPYQAIGRCIYDRLNEQTGGSSWGTLSAGGGLSSFLYRLDDQPDQRRARIDAMSVGGAPSAEFEITVEPAAAGTSRVEYRRRWGGFRSTDQAAWNVVLGCGQRQARDPSPPAPIAAEGASANREVASTGLLP